MLTISGRALGKKRKLFEDFSVPLPPSATSDGNGGPLTLRDLITRIVLHEVQAFRDRQQKRRLEFVLSKQQIQDAVESGKVDMGRRELDQKVDEGQAVATALEAFTDGLYLVIIDGIEYRDLDQIVAVGLDSTVTFIRLVFLAGA
jgi:hypothetical protein